VVAGRTPLGPIVRKQLLSYRSGLDLRKRPARNLGRTGGNAFGIEIERQSNGETCALADFAPYRDMTAEQFGITLYDI
jgi:hypothetical protein